MQLLFVVFRGCGLPWSGGSKAFSGLGSTSFMAFRVDFGKTVFELKCLGSGCTYSMCVCM